MVDIDRLNEIAIELLESFHNNPEAKLFFCELMIKLKAEEEKETQ